MLLIVYMGVVSLSFHAGFMDAPMLIANTWFIRKRTMAMALISGSIGDRRIYFYAVAVRRGAQLMAGVKRRLAAVLLLSLVVCRWHFWCVARRKVWDCCRTGTRSCRRTRTTPGQSRPLEEVNFTMPTRSKPHRFGF